MKERTSSTINIMRDGEAIAEVVIGSSSVRVFKLMEQDYLRLDFVMVEPMAFVIGDYIDDPIFGRFVMTKEQMPSYDTTNAAYNYNLEFEAEYMTWRNKMFCLTTTLSGVRARKEGVWTMTDKLPSHAQELIYNLEVLGFTGYSYDITSCEKSQEVRCMSYSGINIIDAMKSIADAFETEWWVDGKVIHFGKCEIDNEPFVFDIEDNVDSMDIQENRNAYANKLYVYGSTKNIPYSYRKKLVLTVIEKKYYQGVKYYKVDKALTTDMVSLVDSFKLNLPSTVGTLQASGNNQLFGNGGDIIISPNGTYRVHNTMSIALYGLQNIPYTKKSGASTQALKIVARIMINYPDSGRSATVISSKEIEYLPKQKSDGTYYFYETDGESIFMYVDVDSFKFKDERVRVSVQLSVTPTGCVLSEDRIITMGGYLDAEINTSEKFYYSCKVNGEDSFVAFTNAAKGSQTYSCISIDGDDDLYSDICEPGDEIEVPSDSPTIPSSFFTTPYDDPSSLTSIGDLRLMLPEDSCPGGYIKANGVSERDAVEAMVVFEDIYPDCNLIASQITTVEKKDYTEYEGETEKTDWQWTEYTLVPKIISTGDDFKFKTEWVLPNTTLQIQFLTPMEGDTRDNACRLAGMAFDVQFNHLDGTFTIVRNKDYGALLPNDVLCPTVGDPFVLIGWNVRAMSNLGLIDSAESELYEKAQEYLDAMEQSQFSFTCTMKSDWMFGLVKYENLVTSDGKMFLTNDGKQFQVKNEFGSYVIPGQGTKVTIRHGSLKSDKNSRVIGYEVKVDKPYDSPKYIVGETDAYSRLAKIEKEITSIK